jgi:hypothetical protein
MKLWKYLLIAATLISWLAVQLLGYVSRYADWPLLYICVACGCVLFLLALVALIRLRWREFASFSLPLIVVLLPMCGVKKLSEWLQATGFRIYASPVESYLSRCKLYDFLDDDGAGRQVGECYAFPDILESHRGVIYDTTGQLLLPAECRTKSWRSAMDSHLFGGAFVARANGASRIFGDFYSVEIPFTRKSYLLSLAWLREPYPVGPCRSNARSEIRE